MVEALSHRVASSKRGRENEAEETLVVIRSEDGRGPSIRCRSRFTESSRDSSEINSLSSTTANDITRRQQTHNVDERRTVEIENSLGMIENHMGVEK